MSKSNNRHNPSNEVNCKPDRDVKGRAVKPVHVEGVEVPKIPKQIQVQLQIPLKEVIKISGFSNTLQNIKNFQKPVLDESKINLGSFTIDDGVVKYEGEPIKDKVQENIQKYVKTFPYNVD